ncbi:c-di-AMP phosphodiesterase, consists of a GGDEF-like and DHH domains [Seinonella peptonophila]|uniref:Cyclic-di-AMP phosphodiesterase n=1 Tax=Seinonella peptonophila TaxID=112248 RepID=A0A1M4WXJ0_9BACL|nr:DHH family phosphoesterase [Seinonella peptonophila]SHE85956.1 c-di-AMP phosphodiesterase, consists of a GGDEF-like and DHH domains [Seinonella peptonophila]
MPKFTKRYRHSYLLLFFLWLIFLVFIYHFTSNWWLTGLGGGLWFLSLLFVWLQGRLYQDEWRRALLLIQRRVIQGHRFAIHHLPYGLVLINDDGVIEWHNQYVSKKMNVSTSSIGKVVDQVFPLDLEHLRNPATVSEMALGESTYEVSYDSKHQFLLFRDITELVQLEEKYEQEQPIVGYLYIDNYDEVRQQLTDQEETILLNTVNSMISAWTERYQISLKRFDVDKMFFVTQALYLRKLIESHFDILDEMRNATHDQPIPLTLSMGVSNSTGSVLDRAKTARAALNVALARGGDQTAVQEKERLVFFGGKTNAIERRTRVRARVISHAMSNLFRANRRVVIMGHMNPDLDAIGAAVGVACFAQYHQCEPHIILNESNPSIDRVWKKIKEYPTIESLFSLASEVEDWIHERDTLLVMVDTHRPSLTIEPKLLERVRHIVVIDHHRRGEDFVEDPILVYLEPYASSACELVTELLQYQDEQCEMSAFEATLLLAGIVVDTKHFAFRTGSRTFEAASFLREKGADLALVQSLLKEDLDQYIKRAEMLKQTEMWGDEVAVAVGKEDEVYDQLLIAQAADTLLNMKGVAASFVIAKRKDGLVAISARSQGEINVQLIMEAMGGGGHFTNAASQMKDCSLEETKEILKKVVEKYSDREEKD